MGTWQLAPDQAAARLPGSVSGIFIAWQTIAQTKPENSSATAVATLQPGFPAALRRRYLPQRRLCALHAIACTSGGASAPLQRNCLVSRARRA